jgi:hypothetical protein
MVALTLFGLGYLKSADRWEPFAFYLNQAVGPNQWQAQTHSYDQNTNSLIIENLTLLDGSIFGLKGKVSVKRVELVGSRFDENHASAELLMVQGLANELPEGALRGKVSINYFEMERLDLTGPPAQPAISADQGLAKNLTADFSQNQALNPELKRKLAVTLERAFFSGGIVLAPSGRLSVNQSNLNNLTLTIDPGDNPSLVSLASLQVRALDEKARSQTLELTGLNYRFPASAQNWHFALRDLTLGQLKVQALDLGPMVQGLTHLSLTELAELWLTGPVTRSYGRLSAALPISRPFMATKADLFDLTLTTLGGETISAKEIAVNPLQKFNLKAQIKDLGLDLSPLAPGGKTQTGQGPTEPAQTELAQSERAKTERDPAEKAPTEPDRAVQAATDRGHSPGQKAWFLTLYRAGLLPLTANLELSSLYDPSEQTYSLDLSNFQVPELFSANLKLRLTDIDRASLVSLSRLTVDNPTAPLMESGLHHSKLTDFSIELIDDRLTERLIDAMSPGPAGSQGAENLDTSQGAGDLVTDDGAGDLDTGEGADPESLDESGASIGPSEGGAAVRPKGSEPLGAGSLAAKSQRLSDLFEMALTMRFDNVIANTKEISESLRTFLLTSEKISLTVTPDPPLSPGEVRFSRDISNLMNSININVAVNDQPPLKVLFRTEPRAFDRGYTLDDYGLYPGEMRP